MTISNRRWRRAASAILSMSIPLAAAACQTANRDGGGQLQAPDSVAATPAMQARAELEGRLAEVERQLAGKLIGEARAKVARERLVLYLALTEIDRRIAAGEPGVALDELVASARLRWAEHEMSNARPGQVATSQSRGPRVSPITEELVDEDERTSGAPRTTAIDTDSSSADKPADDFGPAPPADEHQLASRGDKTGKPILDSHDESGGKDKDHRSEVGGIEKARVEAESRPRSLMTAVARQVGAMESCLGGLDSDVTLQVTVRLDAAGAIRVARVDGVPSAPANCVAGVLRRVRVRDHAGGTRVVRFPLYFQPD